MYLLKQKPFPLFLQAFPTQKLFAGGSWNVSYETILPKNNLQHLVHHHDGEALYLLQYRRQVTEASPQSQILVSFVPLL